MKAEGELSRFGLNTNLNVREESKEETRFLADFSPRWGEQKEGGEKMSFVWVMRDCQVGTISRQLELQFRQKRARGRLGSSEYIEQERTKAKMVGDTDI